MIYPKFAGLYFAIEKQEIWKQYIKPILKKLGFGKLFWSVNTIAFKIGVKLRQVRQDLGFHYYRILKSSRKFVFQDRKYRYFYHRYNTTWMNERAAEVPIIWEIVKGYSGKRILEIGNVLSHYFFVDHDVVDKYEKAKYVINEDVVNFRPSRKYDLIVSISTLEHVGWDEEPREPYKILRAIENLRRCLSKEGKIVITLPIGQNPELDKLLKNGDIEFTETYFLRRMTKDNKWVESSWQDIKNSRYCYPFPWANGLIVGIIK